MPLTSTQNDAPALNMDCLMSWPSLSDMRPMLSDTLVIPSARLSGSDFTAFDTFLMELRRGFTNVSIYTRTKTYTRHCERRRCRIRSGKSVTRSHLSCKVALAFAVCLVLQEVMDVRDQHGAGFHHLWVQKQLKHKCHVLKHIRYKTQRESQRQRYKPSLPANKRSGPFSFSPGSLCPCCWTFSSLEVLISSWGSQTRVDSQWAGGGRGGGGDTEPSDWLSVIYYNIKLCNAIIYEIIFTYLKAGGFRIRIL